MSSQSRCHILIGYEEIKHTRSKEIFAFTFAVCKCTLKSQGSINTNGLFTLPDSDSDSDSDYCTMQKFPIAPNSDSDLLIEIQ